MNATKGMSFVSKSLLRKELIFSFFTLIILLRVSLMKFYSVSLSSATRDMCSTSL